MQKFFTCLAVAALMLAGCSDSGVTNPDLDRPSAKGEIASDQTEAQEIAQDEAGAQDFFALYEVKIKNLTSGQPFTPPVVATHNASADIFTVGQTASFALKEVAENGNLDPLVEALSNDENVNSVVVAVAGDPPPVMPGQSVTFTITTDQSAQYISFASMLICTNDGFTGLDSQHLPKREGDKVTFFTNAYDAGTEINTEDFADIVPPCPILTGVPSDDPGTDESNPALAEGGVIHHHAGIQGGVDLLPEIHGWTDPVAKVTIERKRP